MLKFKINVPLLTAGVAGVLIGWGGCNLSDWYTRIRNKDSDGFGLVYDQNMYHCIYQNRSLLLQGTKERTQERQSAFDVAYFNCMTERFDALNQKVTGAVKVHTMFSCSMKTGDDDKSVRDACTQKTLEEFARRRSLQVQPSEK
ncbi:hypothetical protein V462_10605 [Pantoea ananatis 15320]|uniref:hypothetical protein n=1 Tax=Pantoea ananas TaxID=553 RepID=UPI000464D98F|nr:hypothetical protein [Pantoea ananatis]PKC36338.1 hypothetical protein V462_10605 [Pantoea ananatis 15320]